MIKKPMLDTAAALDFAEQKPKQKPKQPPLGNKIPLGDVRLTANISKTHHKKIKMVAASQETTIGELLEQLIDKL